MQLTVLALAVYNILVALRADLGCVNEKSGKEALERLMTDTNTSVTVERLGRR